MKVLKWEDPPPPDPRALGTNSTPYSQWIEVAAELRSRPGEWGIIYRGTGITRGRNLVNQIRTGGVVCFRPAGSFEAASRTRRSCVTVYARWIGEQ